MVVITGTVWRVYDYLQSTNPKERFVKGKVCTKSQKDDEKST